jgi:hypothetical protein
MVLTTKRGTNLETKLLKDRHMSRLEFFYLGFRNSILKLMGLVGALANFLHFYNVPKSVTSGVRTFEHFEHNPLLANAKRLHFISLKSGGPAPIRTLLKHYKM